MKKTPPSRRRGNRILIYLADPAIREMAQKLGRELKLSRSGLISMLIAERYMIAPRN